MTDDPTTVVIGIDGAHYEILEPWLEEGRLPNINQAIQDGVSADLECVLPPTTSPNWQAYSTGKDPGKLGIFWWENVNVHENSIYYPWHRRQAHPSYWKRIARDDTVGIIGVPTHQPKPVNGFHVAGAPDGDNDNLAYPDEVEAELREQFDYKAVLETNFEDDFDAATEEALDLINLRFEAAERLLETYDPSFIQITTFYINTLQHFVWNDDPTRRAWEIVDEHVGRFLNNGDNVVLMSDHGATEIESAFYINRYFEKQGLLQNRESQLTRLLESVGLYEDNIKQILSYLRIKSIVKAVLPDWILKSAPDQENVHRPGKKDHLLDWENTKVLGSGQGPVYINLPEGTPEYSGVREEIMTELRQLTTPAGEKIADNVYKGEEVYTSEYPREIPDIIVDESQSIHISGGFNSDDLFSDSAADRRWRGENKREGMFVATGPDFSSGEVETLSILDLAPTLLHLHDKEIPTDMDGDVSLDVFAQGSEPLKREIRYDDVGEREMELSKVRGIARNLDL